MNNPYPYPSRSRSRSDFRGWLHYVVRPMVLRSAIVLPAFPILVVAGVDGNTAIYITIALWLAVMGWQAYQYISVRWQSRASAPPASSPLEVHPPPYSGYNPAEQSRQISPPRAALPPPCPRCQSTQTVALRSGAFFCEDCRAPYVRTGGSPS